MIFTDTCFFLMLVTGTILEATMWTGHTAGYNIKWYGVMCIVICI